MFDDKNSSENVPPNSASDDDIAVNVDRSEQPEKNSGAAPEAPPVAEGLEPDSAPVLLKAVSPETPLLPEGVNAEAEVESAGHSEEGAPVEDEGDSPVGPAKKSRRRRRSSRSKKSRLEVNEAAEHQESLPDKTSSSAPEQEQAESLSAEEQNGQSKPTSRTRKVRRRKMFVCVLPEEQVEVALAEDGRVQEYYVEMLHQAKIKGNIYKGVISNIDAGLQAAFINYGAEKNGFLQIDEIHPEYYLSSHDHSKGHRFPLIQKVLKPGMEMLVQVVKEPSGTKGAFLTTYLSLAGRYIVLTPGREQIGVSRKIEDEEERHHLKEVADTLGPGLGIIVRTVSAGTSKSNLTKDLQYLKRLWKEIKSKGQEAEPPALIYQEPDLAERAVRDYLTEDVAEIWVDHQPTADRMAKMAALIYPRRSNLVKVHNDQERGIWERFNILKQIAQIHGREVTLPSGGRLVFDQTEALMAVDINSGKFTGKNFPEMAYRTNMEAATAIAEQLRMRDVGGQVVIDFIELKDPAHCREVEKTLRAALKLDRARHDVGKMTKFGLLQLVRQRLGSSSLSVSTEPCPHCNGSGTRRNMEWQSIQALKEIYRLLTKPPAVEHKQNHHEQKNSGHEAVLEYRTEPELAFYLLNHKRGRLLEMETQYGISIAVLPEMKI